jgi:hypothetical protein
MEELEMMGKMKASIVTKKGFRLAGILGRGPTNQGPNWIPSIWGKARE